jgi:hypothetical protein
MKILSYILKKKTKKKNKERYQRYQWLLPTFTIFISTLVLTVA